MFRAISISMMNILTIARKSASQKWSGRLSKGKGVANHRSTLKVQIGIISY